MGIYLNPGNKGFKKALNGRYVDKTGLIGYINEVLTTSDQLTCVSRPRRFGKTTAAKMLCAYYDKSCDSRAMFEGLEISKHESFEQHLNKYDVIYLDITYFISRANDEQGKGIGYIVSDIQNCVIQELREEYPDCIAENITFLPDALAAVNKKTGDRFFFIIDEWDALYREAKNDAKLQDKYIQLLRGLFKSGNVTDDILVGAYMTGILPIKKYGTESALTDFREFSMVEPDFFTQYVGFTEDEVVTLCEKYRMDFDRMKMWYDGYSFPECTSVYSPNSVMEAVARKRYGNYWVKTESFKSLQEYIDLDKDGLRAAIISMLGGQRVEVDTLGFQNDMVSMSSRDDVLTLLVHLGYLAYDSETKEVYIPNLEVADSFKLAVRGPKWKEVGNALRNSTKLLSETISGNCEYVAEALEAVHQDTTSILKYNDENSLACVLLIAYYTARNDYNIIRELPSGKGFADFAFIPRRHSNKPALLVELKYDKTAETAMQQIKDKNYVGSLNDYTDNLLLVGINYDAEKKHTCIIEKYTKQ